MASEYTEAMINRIMDITRVSTFFPEPVTQHMRGELAELVDQILSDGGS